MKAGAKQKIKFGILGFIAGVLNGIFGAGGGSYIINFDILKNIKISVL